MGLLKWNKVFKLGEASRTPRGGLNHKEVIYMQYWQSITYHILLKYFLNNVAVTKHESVMHWLDYFIFSGWAS